MSRSEFESSLNGLPQEAIRTAIERLTNEEIVRLLDSKSRRIGDEAASILASKDEAATVARRVLDGTIRTKLGKIRATNLLNWRGRQFSGGAPVYLALIGDRSPDVVSNALFGLAFLQDKAAIPAMLDEARRRPSGDRARDRFLLAIEAIEKRNPFIYSPYFRDAYGVWELDPKRFPDGGAPKR